MTNKILSFKNPVVISLSVFFLSGQSPLSGQAGPVNRADHRVHVQKAETRLSIDGILDEDVWSVAERAGHFYRILPIDTGYARAQTEVMLAYDKTDLYMAIICHDTLPGKRPVESLRRDFNFGKNDNFLVFMDTYNDQTNGFSFGVSAAGAQWDGLQANGGFVLLDWDCKWRSAVRNYADRWVAEFSIPFRSIRYRGGDSEWGINFSRLDLKSNEKSSWAPVPRQFQSANLAYTGTLVWDDPLPRSGVRFSLIPYVSGKATQDVAAGDEVKTEAGAGVDAKITLSTSMNLDLTVNPDFSQVEVDRQVTNLDRFELFFPEKRQFFLENSDLFANLGINNVRPFFSRRIGLDSPVRAGARLSGTVEDNWRIGLMNMQTGTKDDVPASNFSVAAIKRKIFRRSNIGIFLTNKQMTTNQDDSTFTVDRYNRVAGMDFNLASADNRWTGKAFFHKAFYPGATDNAFAMAGALAYNTQQLSAILNHTWVGQNYQAEMGFVRRTGFHQMNPSLGYKFYPSSERVANHGPAIEMEVFFDPDFSITDRDIQVGYQVEWLNRSHLSVDVEDKYVKLLAPFDPTNTGGDTLPAGSAYQWNEVELSYTSDTRKLFNYELTTLYGGFYNGTRLSIEGELFYRVQPYGSLAVVASFNRISLPRPYNSADLIIIGPRLDITFTDKIFLTTFVQYNNQIDNLNINMRFQWRYAPVSDLYIVYTGNYLPGNLQTKNRALVAKLSYWFN